MSWSLNVQGVPKKLYDFLALISQESKTKLDTFFAHCILEITRIKQYNF